MYLLQELKNYCTIKNPAGALLLTGEWGCGKTYMIENTLREELRESHVIIRVSLFGITSVEELHKKVKREWIHAGNNTIGKALDKKFIDILGKASTIIPNNNAKNVIQSFLSLDVLDYIEVKNNIENKQVVLVFDDLERSKLSIFEKFGVINDYCENKKFNVIIIADENKLEEDYHEIKEKIVQRTLLCEPDYLVIVSQIIDDIAKGEYATFLTENKESIAALFAGNDAEESLIEEQIVSDYYFKPENEKELEKGKREVSVKRPRNMRSLKASLQDFERVFTLLNTMERVELKKWLLSFLAVSMALKANIIQKNSRKSLSGLEVSELNRLYPGLFDLRFMPEELSNWLFIGVWYDSDLTKCISHRYGITNGVMAKDLVKRTSIDCLEEAIAIDGMKSIIPDVYNGELSLNEYVLFIKNVQLARYYKLKCLQIDWKKVCVGIEKSVENSIQRGEKEEKFQITIDNLKDYLAEERNAYNYIKEIREKYVIIHGINKRNYINAMQNIVVGDILNFTNLRFDHFDIAMADETRIAYEKVDNATKKQFPSTFKQMWRKNRGSIGTERINESLEAIRYLRGELQQLSNKYKEAPFKKKFTDIFVEELSVLIDEEKEEEVLSVEDLF